MTDSAALFYDQLAARYQLMATGWDEEVIRQGGIFDRLIKTALNRADSVSVLDCSCGIGTQAIGLARQGHRVSATDISASEIEQARQEAVRLGVNVRFGVSDFRELSCFPGENFDSVLAIDNAIAHMLTEQDLVQAFRSMKGRLRPEGTLLISVRDYDQLTDPLPTGTLPATLNDHRGQRIVFQTWAWAPSKETYELTLFMLIKTNGRWVPQTFETRMRAWRRSEVISALHAAGLKEIRWVEPAESGYPQPIALSRTNSGLD